MIVYLISLIPFVIYIYLKSLKAIHMLQQNYYDNKNRYLHWIKENPSKTLGNLDLFFLVYLVFIFGKINTIVSSIIFSILCLLFGIEYIFKRKKEQVKKPLVITARVKRILTTEFLIYLVIFILMIVYFNNKYINYYYLGLGMSAYLNYLVIWFVNLLNRPIEKIVYLNFKNKATKKLKNLNIPVIGITGSYGKTSCKNIVSDILNVKINAVATPKSFNTNYGIIKTINENLDKFSDVFIAEMGACKLGEIKSLCDLVHPNYGIITKIGEAHLETFKSRENIQKCKFELAESIPEDGVIVLNKDDEQQVSYDGVIKCQKIWISIDKKSDFQAKNIELSSSGSKFTVNIQGKDYTFKTKLLGKHNIYNILGAVALGTHLKIKPEDLVRGVMRVKQVPHRLELKKVGLLNVIDDAFNSNPVGAASALDVLSMMEGTKIIATPGMVELGSEEYKLNYEFGAHIAKVCDYVILVGKRQTKPINDALINNNFPKDNIFIINNVKDAFSICNGLPKGEKYLLLENDLPDLFNEEDK